MLKDHKERLERPARQALRMPRHIAAPCRGQWRPHRFGKRPIVKAINQAGMLMERIAQAEPGIVAAAAHTLKGSARGIGAWQVARAADTVEAAATSSQPNLPKAVSALAACIAEARVAIADLLRAH